MQLHQITRKNKNTKSRQVGRGGKRGKTAGRGTKGQKARAGRKMRPELRDIIKKIPKQRGRGKNSNTPINESFAVVNLSVLEKNFNSNDNVSIKELMDKKIVRRISGKVPKVKILAKGDLTKGLNIKGLTVSAKAQELIKKAGGQIA